MNYKSRPTPLLDLSTTNETIIVDKRLLDSFFKTYVPAHLEDIKKQLKCIIDNSTSIEEMNDTVSEHLYITSVATKFHSTTFV